MGEEPIAEVESFKYLGSIVEKKGGSNKYAMTRIGKARGIFHMLKNIWKSRELTVKTKLMIFNSNIKTVLLYGCETWRTTRKTQQKIQTFVNRCLRTIFRINWFDKIPNEELWKRADEEPIGKQILRKKWSWIGHTLRKDDSNLTKQALTWNPQGKRKRGRPRNSWKRDTEIEMKKANLCWTDVNRKPNTPGQ